MAKTRKSQDATGLERAARQFDPEALEALLGERQTLEEVDELFRAMKKALMEKILAGELTHHLGYGAGETKPTGQPNHRNGRTRKTVLTEDGAIPLAIPRDRAGTFEPQLIPKHARRLPRFDQNVISLYARGMTVREIRDHLEELYQVPIAPDVISTVTDAVIEEVTSWQQRALDPCYPVVFFDALRVKVRDEGAVRTKAVYVALGIRSTGQKEVLGLWIEQSEGAAFWHRVLTELTNRGVSDILVALVDGLAGFPEAITAVFPRTDVHQCVVHLLRASLTYVPWKDRKQVADALKPIARAATREAAEQCVRDFRASAWGAKYPTIAPIWERAWPQLEPLFKYPLPIRRLLSTTNAVESLHMQLRKIIKTRGHFPTDEAALKLLFLALRNISKKWQKPSHEWRAALPHFVVLFGERFTPVTD